jgi:predicted Zn-dependent peptidase
VALPPPVADVRRTELPHGVRVLTDVVPTSSSATIAVWVGVGGRDEPDHEAGASHFLEHLLFKGTEQRGALELALEIDGVGGDMNAYTASEYTSYYARVPAVEADVAVELLLDVVAAPALRAEEFAAEREVILEELAAADDDPEDMVGVHLFEALFPGHPLGREVLGSVESIAALTRDDVAAFFAERYRPANLVVTGAGLVDHDELVEQVAARLDVGASGRRPERSAPPEPVESVVVAHDPGELIQLAWGWRTGGVHDERRFALAVLNHILGAGPSSRLFQRVREEHALTYSISSGVSQYTDAGALSVACTTTPGKAARLVELVSAEVDHLAEGGISSDELARAQRSMRGALLLGLEDSSSRGARLGLSETLRGQVTPLPEHLARIDAVQLEQVAEVAAEVLGGPKVLSLVGPGELESLAR